MEQPPKIHVNGHYSVMHPVFQKLGSVSSWFLKSGAHITKYGFNKICQICEHLATGKSKHCGHLQIFFGKATRPRSECIPRIIDFFLHLSH